MPARRPTALLLALRRVQQSRSGTVAETAPQCWQASGVLGNCDEGTRRTAKYATFVNTKEPQRFIDTLLVSVKAGDGGSGASTFWGSVAKGRHQPADGGNGGPGGDVFVCASSSQRSLRGIRQVQRAENGGTGQRQKKRGRTGKDVTILVPVGTAVSKKRSVDDEAHAHASGEVAALRADWQTPWVGSRDYRSSDEDECDSELGNESAQEQPSVRPRRDDSIEQFADLVEHGQQVCVARGGRGGKGNAAFSSKPNRPASREHEPGFPGESCTLHLEMKLLADVGLVGQPNAGKSTLLQALSAARPKIADYPFTTLRPQLGVIQYGDSPSVAVADIPGLVAGAAEANKGLGHDFLRHIERTRVLAFVLDLSSGSLLNREAPTPLQQLEMLQAEVQLFSPDLQHRPALVVANKVDQVASSDAAIGLLRDSCSHPIVAVSALLGHNIPALKAILRAMAFPPLDA